MKSYTYVPSFPLLICPLLYFSSIYFSLLSLEPKNNGMLPIRCSQSQFDKDEDKTR